MKFNSQLWVLLVFTGMTLLLAGCMPEAAFSVDPDTGPAPLDVDFSDTSMAGNATITAWSWTFGDGGFSTLQNPGHTYTVPGCYDVSLSITTSAGVFDTTVNDAVCVSAEGEGEGEGFLEGEGELCGGFCAACDSFIAAGFTMAQVPSPGYTPGGTVDVQITLDYTGGDTVLALGCRNYIPPGWTFNSYPGAQPGASLPDGYALNETTGLLEFVYGDVPTLPVTFTYRLDVPGNATGAQALDGCGEIRFDGAGFVSPVVMNTLIPN